MSEEAFKTQVPMQHHIPISSGLPVTPFFNHRDDRDGLHVWDIATARICFCCLPASCKHPRLWSRETDAMHPSICWLVLTSRWGRYMNNSHIRTFVTKSSSTRRSAGRFQASVRNPRLHAEHHPAGFLLCVVLLSRSLLSVLLSLLLGGVVSLPFLGGVAFLSSVWCGFLSVALFLSLSSPSHIVVWCPFGMGSIPSLPRQERDKERGRASQQGE